LNFGTSGAASGKAVRLRVIQNDIVAAKKGDWNSRRALLSEFRPLLQSMAEKRARTPEELRTLVQAGEEGVARAVRKFRLSDGADHFQVFALPYIEKAMEEPGRRGFLARIFGKR
jgi:DNA-directed RNA polymerase specialized sigma subunit